MSGGESNRVSGDYGAVSGGRNWSVTGAHQWAAGYNPRFFSEGVHNLTRRAQLTVNLDCLETTEDGEDEVYFIVAGKDDAGRTWKSHLPGDHWDMNDGDRANSHLNGINVAAAGLPAGQSVAWDAAGSDQVLPPPNSQRFRMDGDSSRYHVTSYVK